MDLKEYLLRSSAYESTLTTEYKKTNGVFYTDIDLSEKIIKFLNIPIDSSIIDPCCGIGSFIVSAKKLGYSNLYGADIDFRAVDILRKKIELENLKTLDTIFNSTRTILESFNIENKVDFIIGNPPYAKMNNDVDISDNEYLFLRNVKSSGNNLFIASIYRALELVKEGGTISYIIPKNFLHVFSYRLLRKTLLREKRISSIIDIGKKFKEVRGEQIVINIVNNYDDKNDIKIYKLENDEFVYKLSVPQKFYDDEIILFENNEEFEIYKKMESSYEKFSDICKGYVGRGKSKDEDSISGKDIRKFSFKNKKIPKDGNKIFLQNIYSAESGIIGTFAGSFEAGETVTVFTDSDPLMCRYVLGILHSRLCNFYLLNFCFNNSRLTMHVDAKYLKRIPLIINNDTFSTVVNLVKKIELTEYMSEEWFDIHEKLNEMIYYTYKIEGKQKEYIEKKIKKIQSKRWINDK